MKKIIYLSLFLIIGLVFINNVKADDENLTMDERCAKQYEETKRCGQPITTCKWFEEDGGYCAANPHDQNAWDTANATNCAEIKDPTLCKTALKNQNYGFACVWNKNSAAAVSYIEDGKTQHGYCNTDNLLYVSCGGAHDIPKQIPQITSMAVNLLKIATPIVLVFVSAISLVKAIASSKEDEIKKAQNGLIRRIIAAAIIFFVITIVQFVISKAIDEDDEKSFTNCLNCFLNNSCEGNTYYKTTVLGQDYCTSLTKGNDTQLCKAFFGESDDTATTNTSTSSTNSKTTTDSKKSTTKDEGSIKKETK